MIGKLLFVASVVIWFTKENKAVNWRLKQHPGSPWDASSLQILMVGSTIALVLGFLLSWVTAPLFSSQWLAVVVGLAVMALGAWVRIKAVTDLQEQFTPNVVILSDHKLFCDGIYRHVRHPGYAGALVLYAGMALLLNSGASFVVMLLILVPIYLYRIVVEEKALQETFGDEYRQYSARVKRLIPRLY